MAKRKLGRGLDMLISRGETRESGEPSQGVLFLSPSQIEENPQQPRTEFGIEDLETLKTSISKDGVLQPLLVRKIGDRYQLVAGERRLRASRELALEKVPVILTSIPDERLLEVALVENIHRADLNPVELAQAYRHLMDFRDWTQDQLSTEIGVSRSAISNTIRLLDLPEDIRRALVRGQISMGHAKVLLGMPDEKTRRRIFEQIAEENLSVRETEIVRDEPEDGPEPGPDSGVEEDLEDEVDDQSSGSGGGGSSGGKGRRTKKDRKSPNLERLEQELREALGTRVTICLRGKRQDKGVISISFDSKDAFQRLRSLLLNRVEV